MIRIKFWIFYILLTMFSCKDEINLSQTNWYSLNYYDNLYSEIYLDKELHIYVHTTNFGLHPSYTNGRMINDTLHLVQLDRNNKDSLLNSFFIQENLNRLLFKENSIESNWEKINDKIDINFISNSKDGYEFDIEYEKYLDFFHKRKKKILKLEYGNKYDFQDAERINW